MKAIIDFVIEHREFCTTFVAAVITRGIEISIRFKKKN